MAIQQDIVLNFKTNLEQAKTSIGELATLHQQSLIPQGQPGALDDTQKAEVESLVTQRAQDKGISLDDTKKVLTEIAAIEEQINALSIGRVEREQKISELNEKAGAAAANRILQENKAKELVGLTAKATREQLEAKITALKIGKNLNISEEERVKQLEEVDKLLKSAQSYGGVATRNSNKAVELANEQAMALQTQEDAFARIAVIGKEITLNAEELDTLITYTTKGVIDRNKAEKQNTKEKEKAVKLAEKETQETEDLNRLLETQPDNFAKRAISAVIYYEALNQLKRIARAAVNTIKDLDRALTDIAVVTSMTRQESWELLGTYQDMAKQVGLTTTEVAKLSIEFFRQGREARDALELTRTAAEFAKIAAISVQDAANFLTAAINGFNLAASDATSIIDKFAALGAGAAASAQEIAIALSKVAPAAAAAGVEVDNLMAFVTKGIETTREAPENIGTAFKTIFARMRELTDIGKTIEDGMDVNRVEASLRSIGVALRDSNGEFRDLDDILIEVGKRWNSTTRNQQAYLATTLAGARQQTRLIALFDNFDRTLELIELSQNSAGEAAIQHDEYMQGLEATTTRLQTSFQELITSFVSSDLIIGALNAFNTAIELLNTRVGRLLITLGSVALAIGAVKNATTGALGAVSAFFMGQIDEETQIRAPISMFKTLTTSLVKEGDFKTFRANAAKAFEGFKASAQGATNYLKQGFIPAINSAASFIGIAFTNAHHSVSLFAKATKDTLVNLAGSFKSIVLDRLTIVSRQYLSTLQGTLLAASKQMGQSMQNLRINIPKLDPLSIQQTFKAAFDPMTPYFSTLRTVFSTFYKTITEGAIKAFTTIKSGFINLGPSIKDTIAGFKAYRKQIAAIQKTSFDLSDPVKNIALQKKAINDLAQQSRFAGNSLVGMSNKTGNVFLKLGPMLVAPFKMLASFLLSPAGIVLVIIGLIVAFKKIREATDTTNPTIARLKVAFDRVAKGVNNFVKAIADFLVPLLKSLWPAIKVLLGPMGMLIGLFTNLNEAEEAAASLRVLTNEYKAMNKEVRETEKQLLKLNKTLKDFTDLNRATFKSSAQMEQLEEVRQQIKDILEEAGVATMGLTTAQLEDELTIMIQEQEKEVKRQYDIMGRKIKQFFAENPLLNFEDALLDPAFDEELKDSLGVFAQEYAKMVIDGFDGMAPEVQAAILRMVRVDPAQFLDQTKEVQKAFRSTIAVLGNRNDFLPGVSKVFQIIEGETMEEAFERFSKTLTGGVLIKNLGYTFADFAEQVEDSFATVNSEVSELYTTTIPEVTKALELIQSPQFDNDFVKGLAQLQEIDLSKLNADELDSLFQAFPNLESILNLPAAQDALGEYTEAVLRLQERGGVAFLRQFDGIRRAVDNLKIEENLESSTVTQTRRVNIEVDDSYWKKGFVMAAGQSLEQAFNDFLAENPGSKITFEEFAEQVKDNITTTMTGVFNADTADQIQGYLLDSFTSSKDLYATASALGEEIARGSIDGVELGFEEQQELLSSIFNFLDSKTIEEITQSTYAFLDDISKLGEIAQKRGSYTADDLNLLRKYPGVMQQIAAGEFDILAFKEEQLENTKNTIVAEKNRSVVALSTQAHLLNMQLLSNKLTEEQRKSTQAQLDALKGQIAETAAYYDLLLDVVEASDDDAFLNSQKELLNIQKQSIERARQLRDLQKEAAEAVSKAIQATRVGAVGTIEAQFNQAQLNKEIAEANRRLEEEIILAQIEAQQKILEDSQQKAILEATGDNTTATNTNSDRLRVLTDAVNKILGPSGRRQILSTNSGGGAGEGSLGILNDVVSIQG